MVSLRVSSPDALISHLDSIFARDPHIDELGIVHPSQISSLQSGGPFAVADAILYTGLSSAPRSAAPGAAHPEEESCKGFDLPIFDDLVFYCGDHKLAIAHPALNSLYGVATAMFSVAREEYKALLAARKCQPRKATPDTEALLQRTDASDDRVEGNVCKVLGSLEDKLLSSSRALVLVNCDHATAWNVRKLILSRRERNQDALYSELRLASIVLSYAPKSEEAWAQRRWVINLLLAGVADCKIMDCFLAEESVLVEHIAERSPMNYRAWRHRYWLASLMSLSQITLELERTKHWAQFHVSDNCCFHYRRCLLLRVAQACNFNRPWYQGPKHVGNNTQPFVSEAGFAVLCKEEVAWIRDLLHQYIGHEALWIHGRFLLALCLPESSDACIHHDKMDANVSRHPVPIFSAQNELTMVDACISSCPASSLYASRQRELAAAYKLWLLALLCKESRLLRVTSDIPLPCQSSMVKVLEEVSPHRNRLWNGLVRNVIDVAQEQEGWPDLLSGTLENMQLDPVATERCV